MAQRIIRTDDLDGSDGAEAMTFSINDTKYEIDLNDANYDKLLKSLEPFTKVARRVGTKSRKAGARTQVVSSKHVREWALSNGFDIPSRGRVPKDAQAAYDAAH